MRLVGGCRAGIGVRRRVDADSCPSGTPQELEHRRLRAVQLLSQGFAPVEVACQVGVDRIRHAHGASRVPLLEPAAKRSVVIP